MAWLKFLVILMISLFLGSFCIPQIIGSIKIKQNKYYLTIIIYLIVLLVYSVIVVFFFKEITAILIGFVLAFIMSLNVSKKEYQQDYSSSITNNQSFQSNYSSQATQSYITCEKDLFATNNSAKEFYILAGSTGNRSKVNDILQNFPSITLTEEAEMIVGILEYAKENSKDETLKALKNVIDEWINNCDRIDVNLYAKRMYNIGVYFFVLFIFGLLFGLILKSFFFCCNIN